MSVPPWKPGTLFWDTNSNALSIYSTSPNTTLQIGRENWVIVLAGEYIPNGAAVYIATSNQGFPVARLAISDGFSEKYAVIGIATEPIQSASIGAITTLGQVHNLDLSLFNIGNTLWLSTTQSGSYTNSPPNDPYQKVLLGYVLDNSIGTGVMQVNITAPSQNSYPFVGMTTVPTMITSSITSGSLVTIGTASVNLCTTSDGSGQIKNYTLNSASFSITSSFIDAQYIIASYNNGNPTYQLTTDKSIVDNIQTTIIYTLLNGAGGRLSYTDLDTPGILLANKDYLRVQSLCGVERENGLLISESGSQYFTVTSGKVWNAITPINIAAINSNIDRVVLMSHSASLWSGSFITQFTSTQCDNGTNVVALGVGINHWVVNWVYRIIGNLNSTIVMYSPDYSSISAAQTSQPPDPPSELKDIAILIGRAIYRKGDTTALQIDSAFTQNFTPSITDHNSLTGLQGGITGEYYHLTSTQYSGFGVTAVSASWVSASTQINSSSYANTASYSSNAHAIDFIPSAAHSASWASSSISASFATTASYVSKTTSAETASYFTPRIVTVIGDYSIVGGNSTVIVTGSISSTITLPSSSVSFGVSLFIKNRLPVNMYVKTPDGATIDGDASITSSFKNSTIQLQCSGSEWFII